MSDNPLLVRVSPHAAQDLEDIWLYTFRHWSLAKADAYHKSLMDAIDSLTCGHNIPQQSNVREGYWKYPMGSHVIFFRMSGEFLDIIRIVHEYMDIERHFDAGIWG